MLQLGFQNLGPLKEGTINLKNLTILCGENNTGKTYAGYTIYGMINELRKLTGGYPTLQNHEFAEAGRFEVDFQEELDRLPDRLQEMGGLFSKEIYKIFSSKQEFFKDTRVSVLINEQYLKNSIMQSESNKKNQIFGSSSFEIAKSTDSMNAVVNYTFNIDVSDVQNGTASNKNINTLFRVLIRSRLDSIMFQAVKSKVFLLPAERSGLNLFYRELNAARNELVHGLGTDILNNEMNEVRTRLLQSISPYPTPISDYLTFLNQFENYVDEVSDYQDLASEIQTEILKGSYEVKDQQIFYKNENGTPLHLHVSSSTVKSLFGLVFYLTYIAQPGQYLVIDEPELNLHPDNQRKLARILAKIVNRGIRVILSTHSDYLVKEFNNLLMLSKRPPNLEQLMEKYGYEEGQILRPDDVAPYLFVEDRIELMEIDPIEGIIAETFDQVINRYNEAADEIYYAIQETENGQ